MTTAINASADTVRLAAAAIGRAALFDDRISQGDKGRIAAWAEALERFEFEQGDVLDAVTRYYEAPGVSAVKVGDVIAAAREIRKSRALKETAETVSVDPQLGLPIAGADGKPIWSAYEQHNAIEIVCRTCNAQPEEACTSRATGRTRKIPCISRLVDGCRRGRVA